MVNVSSFLSRSAARWGDRPALFEDETVVATFAELEARATDIARRLRTDLGLVPGDRVAVVAKNCARYLELVFAAWRAELTLAPINARLHPKEIAYILADSGARLCFAATEDIDAIAEASPKTALADIAAPASSWPCAGQAEPSRGAPSPSIAWLFYTSGTTGRPKGVMITHDMLRQALLNYFADVDWITPEDCIIHFAPLSHGSGMYALPHIAAGAANVVPVRHQFTADGLAALFARHRGISMFMAPTMVRKMLDMPELESLPIDSLKTIIYGGGPMYVADIEEAVRRLGPRFVQIYGQGECPMTITCLSRRDIATAYERQDTATLGSVGRAFTGVEVAVADDAGVLLPAGEIGEVVVRGPIVMPGYWANPQATAETIRHGWLYTGDMGALDARGFLTLKDRSKDLIVSGGMNIYPREIEEVLLHHASVAEASVVGMQDEKWGENVVAFIVAKAGYVIDPQALDAHCLNNLARFKRPKEYRVVEALPKNNYGKVLKRELRHWLTRGDTA